jgi:beta-lactamase superfamily II metal-dependent hydrolase
VVQRLKNIGADIYRTDLNGDIIVTIKKGVIKVVPILK